MSNAAPDWDQIAHDVLCPLCDYNLRGLIEPRCPECGGRFEWPDLVDPARRQHPFLFEHHPERRFWSFWRTAWAGLRPARFWGSLLPVQLSHPRRLVLYAILTLMLFLVAPATIMTTTIVQRIHAELADRANVRQIVSRNLNDPRGAEWAKKLTAGYPSTQAYLDAVHPASLNPREVFGIARGVVTRDEPVMFTIAPLLWPLLTLGFLLIFSEDRRRAGVKPIHVVRCVVYSFDLLIWLTLPVLGLWIDQIVLGGFLLSSTAAVIAGLGLFVGVIMIATYRLMVAYRKYLRVPWGITSVLLSQFVATLGLPAVLVLGEVACSKLMGTR